MRWLLRGPTPDFKTIADFRKDNRAAFQPLLQNFNHLCRSLDLFGAELVAIDGSKFKAVNNPRHHYTQDQLRVLLAQIQARIDDYLTALDTQDAAADVYHCPGGHALPFQKQNLNRGQARGLYYDRAACRSCPLQRQCTTGRCRVIGRHAQEAAVEATAARVAAAPEKVAQRKEIVEHVVGTLRVWGHDEFLLRGLAKVKGEFSLSAVVYNLRRVLNLRSVPDLLAAVRARTAGPGRPKRAGRRGWGVPSRPSVSAPTGEPAADRTQWAGRFRPPGRRASFHSL